MFLPLPFMRQDLILGAILILFAMGCLHCCQSGRQSAWSFLPDESGDALCIISDAAPEDSVDVLVGRVEREWVPCVPGQPLIPKLGRPLWVRISISNPTWDDKSGVLADSSLYADKVDLFEWDTTTNTAGWRHHRAGETVAGEDKPLAGREAAFPLMVKAGEKRTVFIRIEDRFGIPSRMVWWPNQSEFLGARGRTMFVESLYFGGLLVLLFYNAILWIRLRFPDLRHYLQYLTGLAVFMFISRNVWTMLGWAVHSPWTETAALLALALSLVFLVDFARVFLQLKMHAPRLDKVAAAMRWLAIMGVLLSPCLLWLDHAILFHGTVILGFFIQALLLVGALFAWRKGATQARYLAAAFAAFLLGILPSLRMVISPEPQDDTAVAGFALLAGSAMELLLFSLATADRFARLQQEKLSAEAGLRREAEQREILQEAYADDLALEVRERTRELQHANADKDRILTVIGHDLRSPLTGLARAAGHWESQCEHVPGLGKFIKETAQTSHGLLLLIEDLVMWARLRAGNTIREAHSLEMLTSPVLSLFEHQFPEVKFERSMPANLVVLTDSVPLQALLRNLLNNALRAASGSVSIHAVLQANGVRVIIYDDGPGVPVPVAEALNAGDPGRLPLIQGLGLRLCMEISMALDLQLRVDSSVSSTGGGTEFSFILQNAA